MSATTQVGRTGVASADADGLPRLRFRQTSTTHLAIDDTGRFFRTTGGFSARWSDGQLSAEDYTFLQNGGHLPAIDEPLAQVAHQRAVALRALVPTELDYLILVPTLRCNLSCSYCQVSRADENSGRHDWSEETLAGVLALIGRMTARVVKIEFQGGEPTLRPDLLRLVMEACAKFESASFVICTNLSRVDAE